MEDPVGKDIAKLKELPNVKLLGYVSDGQVKWLMQNCKAFIFPSYYEGFGIPPLEALSVGAKIVVGNAASLPEIYKKSAYYIDPEKCVHCKMCVTAKYLRGGCLMDKFLRTK